MDMELKAGASKSEVFHLVKDYLDARGLAIVKIDNTRPWGGFFVIEEKDAEKFMNFFFKESLTENPEKKNKLSPKILLVEPGKRLSWQYHHRRSELWKILQGKVEINISDTDLETGCKQYGSGDFIEIGKGQRHRLTGLSEWGVVAEIWQHTDFRHPSDEDDIVRLKDDFGRNK